MGSVRATSQDPETGRYLGARHYFNTESPDVLLPGVTSIIGMQNKPFLPPWAAKMAAELAVSKYRYLGVKIENEGDDGAVDWLKNASRRYTKERSDIGSMAHDVFERIARGEDAGPVHPDIEQHVAHFGEFIDAVNPEFVAAEDVAWSDTHGYAGSFDNISRIWLDPETKKPTPDRSGVPALLMGDYKTSKNTYPDVSLQLTAYAFADRIVSPDGTSTPMPKFDGAFVLWVTEGQWQLKPVYIGEDVFRVFLALLEVFKWDRGLSKKVIGKPIAGSAKKFQTGTERRAK